MSQGRDHRCQTRWYVCDLVSTPPSMPALPASAHRGRPLGEESTEVIMLRRQLQRTSVDDGGGGNRTRVRNRPAQSVYKLRLPLRFARRPVGSRPTDGLAILWCRASGDWLSLGAEPVSDAATRATGRARSDALRYGLGSESECGVVLRTYVESRLFYEADRGPRLAALPENRPRRNQIAPVCQLLLPVPDFSLARCASDCSRRCAAS